MFVSYNRFFQYYYVKVYSERKYLRGCNLKKGEWKYDSGFTCFNIERECQHD